MVGAPWSDARIQAAGGSSVRAKARPVPVAEAARRTIWRAAPTGAPNPERAAEAAARSARPPRVIGSGRQVRRLLRRHRSDSRRGAASDAGEAAPSRAAKSATRAATRAAPGRCRRVAGGEDPELMALGGASSQRLRVEFRRANECMRAMAHHATAGCRWFARRIAPGIA